MNESNRALLLFQLGPVQKFIAQDETIGDLRAGSEILSRLTAAALRSVPNYIEQTVFPDVAVNQSLDGIPNRFLVFVPKEQAEEVAKKAALVAKRALVELGSPMRERLSPSLQKIFDTQLEHFLQTSWALLAHPVDDFGRNYADISRLLAMRRNTREFDAWPEEDVGRQKDFLSGKESAILNGRGAINLVKQTLSDEPDSTYTFGRNYRAVIAMDGDRMGACLSSFKTVDAHRSFSRKLAEFAREVNQHIPKEIGTVIYAGGDDVLVVVEATSAFDVARRLREAFVEKMKEPGVMDGSLITASTGIAIGSVYDPMQDLIQAAHKAESRAKHVYGRDALAVGVFKRSGEILEWGCGWNSAAFDIYERLASVRRQGYDLSRFAYKLASFLEPYALQIRDEDGLSVFEKSGDMRQVVLEETLHAIQQTKGAAEILSRELLDSYQSEPLVVKRPEDYLGLFMVEAFVNRDRRAEEI